MRKHIDEPPAPEVAVLEGVLTDIIPVETAREEKEAEVERARAAKLKEVAPALRPLDMQEKTLKQQAISLLKENQHKKGFFPRGRRSVSTRAGIAGFKKGPAHLKSRRGAMSEEDVIKWLKNHNRPLYREIVQVIERVHRTRARQAIKAGRIPKELLKKFGWTVVQREHAYVKTKNANRGPKKASVRKRMRKAKTVKG